MTSQFTDMIHNNKKHNDNKTKQRKKQKHMNPLSFDEVTMIVPLLTIV